MSDSLEVFTPGQELTAAELNTVATQAFNALPKDGGRMTNATAETPQTTASGEEVVNAAWVLSKIAGAITSTVASVVGKTGAVTLQMLIDAGLLPASNPKVTGTLWTTGARRRGGVIFDGATGAFAGQKNYVVGPNDDVVVIRKQIPSPTIVTLNAPGVAFRELTIIDGLGDASQNPITIVTAGGTISGADSVIVSSNYDRVHLLDNGIEYNVV